MVVTLDGQKVFDEQSVQIEVGSPTRACIERSAAGLDGVLSIDLGHRGRKVRQAGTLSGVGRAALQQRVTAIEAFLDGDTHTLVTPCGETLENLRMDSFTPSGERTSGAGVSVDYEIVYTQLEG